VALVQQMSCLQTGNKTVCVMVDRFWLAWVWVWLPVMVHRITFPAIKLMPYFGYAALNTTIFMNSQMEQPGNTAVASFK